MKEILLAGDTNRLVAELTFAALRQIKTDAMLRTVTYLA